MTHQFMKVLSNAKYQYFSFANAITMPSIDLNHFKYFKIAVLEFIRNKPSI